MELTLLARASGRHHSAILHQLSQIKFGDESRLFPLPRIEDCVDRVRTATFVTKLDLLKGYWQVPLIRRASEISAFVTSDHFFQYTVRSFGLRNAPATFQRLMHKVLMGVKNCEAYLDDVVACSDTWDEHLKTLTTIFDRLDEASLTLNLSKCEFGKATVTYLGKQVRPVIQKVLIPHSERVRDQAKLRKSAFFQYFLVCERMLNTMV